MDVSPAHGSDSSRHRRDQLILHVVGINDLGSYRDLRAVNFRHPILLVLLFRHLVDHAQNDIAFPRRGSSHEKDHWKFCIPILTITEKNLANFSETEVSNRRVGIDDYGDVCAARLRESGIAKEPKERESD